MPIVEEFGIYQDFPDIVHFLGDLRTQLPAGLLKEAIIEGFIQLNSLRDIIRVSRAGQIGEIDVRRTFEVGIAEGLNFNYLDIMEVRKVREWVKKIAPNRTFDPLDFVVFTHYRYTKKSSKRICALHLDHYFIRINFQKPLLLFTHKCGLQRTPPEEILNLIITFTNDWLYKKILTTPLVENYPHIRLRKEKSDLVEVIPRA